MLPLYLLGRNGFVAGEHFRWGNRFRLPHPFSPASSTVNLRPNYPVKRWPLCGGCNREWIQTQEMKPAKGQEKKNSIPPDIRETAEKSLAAFCDRRVPPHAKKEVRNEFAFRGLTATLFECRPPWESLLTGQSVDASQWTRLPIAQFRYQPANGRWSLYGAGRNSRRHPHDEWGGDITSSPDIKELLARVDEDPTGTFWG